MTLKHHYHDIQRSMSQLSEADMNHQASTNSDPDPDPDPEPVAIAVVEEAPLRSRASSIVTTGTKFSISTLPNEEFSPVNDALARSERNSMLRPHSVFSVASHETSLPPYESPQGTQSTEPSSNQHNIESHMEVSESTGQKRASPTSPTSLTADPENALIMHYGRVVRTIDQNHVNQTRRLKEAHREELGATRHAIDQAYRKEFKAKNHEIEKVREEMASLSAAHDATIARIQREVIEKATEQAQAHQLAIDKACNAIEDMWEGRWNDRIRLADEEASKRTSSHELEVRELTSARDKATEDCRVAILDRDEAWIRTFGAMHPELVEELNDTALKLRLGEGGFRTTE